MSEKVSLALIAKNEEACIARCISSFCGAVDEVVVCDTGSTDRTIEIAKQMGARVISIEWRHDFAAARQASFDACSHPWAIWCDVDDVLAAGCATKVRWLVEQNKADVYMCAWKVEDRVLERERLVRRDAVRWVRPIHEKLDFLKGKIIARTNAVTIIHSPPAGKVKNSERNIASLKKAIEHSGMDLFYLATELAQKGEKDLVLRYARAACELHIGDVERYELLLAMSLACETPQERKKYALEAYALAPYRREALVLLAQLAILEDKPEEAVGFAMSYCALPLPKRNIWTTQHNWYGWQGTAFLSYALRRAGRIDDAQEVEKKARGGDYPNFSLVHASRGRPKQMLEARALWFERADNPAMVEHIFGLDEDDAESIEAAQGYAHIIMEKGRGCVPAWNAAATQCGGKVLIQLSDDWVPPKGWDTILLNRIGARLNEEVVVGVSDGIDRGGGQITQCMCIAIMTRARYLAQGHMFFHGYKSVFSDNEFTDRAYEDGVVIEARDVVFQHVHPLTGLAKMDKTYTESNAPGRYTEGEKLYLERKEKKEGLTHKYAVFILAVKDDFCLFEVIERMLSEGASRVYVGVPSEYWNGAPTHGIDPRLSALYPSVYTIHLYVSKHRAPGRDILITEAMVRNEALARIREDGFEHVLVVDSDELWKRGTLKQLDRYISDNKPDSLLCGMIPVAGLPGYPIEGARDLAMVYLGPKGRFKQCRGSDGPQWNMQRRLILHFSATRRTMEEIIQKHRESGHYSDPEYPMEEWISHKLPHIKPGMRDAHMFTRWSTWPLVRNFTKEEWSDIPETLHKYLGKPE